MGLTVVPAWQVGYSLTENGVSINEGKAKQICKESEKLEGWQVVSRAKNVKMGFQTVTRKGQHREIHRNRSWTRRWGREMVMGRKTGTNEKFTAFVDYVNKKVSRRWLREIFEQFGVVVDVYIAYNNKNRERSETTFGFVRFKTKAGMGKAIDEANGLELEGARLRVVEADKDALWKKQGDDSPVQKMLGRVEKFSEVGTRKLYSEAVSASTRNDIEFRRTSGGVGKVRPRDGKDVARLQGSDEGEELKAANGSGHNQYFVNSRVVGTRMSYDIMVPRNGMEWINACLTGVIKDDYDYEMVEQGMNENGLACYISPWAGLSVIVMFKSTKERDDAFKGKDGLISRWFEKLDIYDPFNSKPELRLWVTFSNTPLVVWHESFFIDICSRWGEVLLVDEETRRRTKLDIARVLVLVEDIEKIPNKLRVKVKGKDFTIRIGVRFAGMEEVEEAMAGDDAFSEGNFEAASNDNQALEIRKPVSKIAGIETSDEGFTAGCNHEVDETATKNGEIQIVGAKENLCRTMIKKMDLNGVGQETKGGNELGRGNEYWACEMFILDPTNVEIDSGEEGRLLLDPIELEISNNLEEINLLNIPIQADQGYWGSMNKKEGAMGSIEVEPIRIIRPRNCGASTIRKGRGKKTGAKIIRASDFLVKPVQRIVKQQKRRRNWQASITSRKCGVVIEELEESSVMDLGNGDDVMSGIDAEVGQIKEKRVAGSGQMQTKEGVSRINEEDEASKTVETCKQLGLELSIDDGELLSVFKGREISNREGWK